MRERFFDGMHIAPEDQPTPELSPEFLPNAQFAFRPNVARWWMRVGGGRCQWENYTEQKGFRNCNEPARHVHHVIPEGVLLDQGLDPNDGIGMPVCEEHHVRNRGGEIFDHGSSFHPDVGEAFKHYKEWKSNELHMNSISGKWKPLDYSTSPFADVAREHKKKTARGERYHTGTEHTDMYYVRKMKQMAIDHVRETGDRKPKSKEHPRTDRKKRKKKWYDHY